MKHFINHKFNSHILFSPLDLAINTFRKSIFKIFKEKQGEEKKKKSLYSLRGILLSKKSNYFIYPFLEFQFNFVDKLLEWIFFFLIWNLF